jgi:hypothetical protein
MVSMITISCLLWWMISQMRLQYPVNMEIKVDMDIASLMSDGVMDHHICYCPVGAAPRKSSRPKAECRFKGAIKRSKKRSN